MKAIKLNFSEFNVEMFSQLFLAHDHHSENHNFLGLFQVLTMWSAGCYHVYCPLADDDSPMGICHGRELDNNFFGHIYFLEEFRGKPAMQGFEKCVSMMCHNLKVDKLITHILPDNKPAKMFASIMGFVKVGETKYICDLKEAS